MDKIFEKLKNKYGSHNAAARALGVSVNRYFEWRKMDPVNIPERSRKLLEFASGAQQDQN